MRRKYTPDLNYHIYKVECQETGQYYISCSCVIGKVKDMHYREILNRIWMIRHYEEDSKRRKKVEPLPEPKLKIYSIIAEFVKPKVDHIVIPGVTICNHYTFKILESVETREQLKVLETQYLLKAKTDPLCTNTNFKSNYNKTFTPKKSAYEY